MLAVVALVLRRFNCQLIERGWVAYRRRLARRPLQCRLRFGQRSKKRTLALRF